MMMNGQRMDDLIKQFKQQGTTKNFKENYKSFVKPPMGGGGRNKINLDFTQITRTGRPIKLEQKEMPDELKRLMPVGLTPDSFMDKENQQQKPIGISSRIKETIIKSIKLKQVYKKKRFNPYFTIDSKWIIDSDNQNDEKDNLINSDNEDEVRKFYP